MSSLTLAAAQTIPFKGDVGKNLATHLYFSEKAAAEGTQLIHFPELSLTGYEPELASDLAFSANDERLRPLKQLAEQKQIYIVAGAPFSTDKGIHIASFIFYPDGNQFIYTKYHLHDGEEKFFIPGKLNPTLTLKNHNISFAICADITHEEHMKKAKNSGADIYLPSVFISPNGIDKESQILADAARNHGMMILMSNFGGPSWKFQTGGRTACWDTRGNELAVLPKEGEGIVMAVKKGDVWSAKTVKNG